MNKKGEVVLLTILIIIIIIVILGWFVREGIKECRSDSECRDGEYCDSRFECRQIPVITQTVQASPSVDYNNAAWIIGIALVIAAVIMKWDTLFKRKRPKNKQHHAEDEGLYEDYMEEIAYK